MSHISLNMKSLGQRSAGNPHAALDVAGAGVVPLVATEFGRNPSDRNPSDRCIYVFHNICEAIRWMQSEPYFTQTEVPHKSINVAFNIN